ncbi:unnamed protein product [Adineta steineri]|uniref:Uncharacterized protein n=1 Tax=Adineta steineri TaxID=433720 RepID=A0A819UBV4_9BILA|nr:unnamed protein product [Adineta steineri]CAF4092132.1 unnamed protein product [Adineta steineri]
MGASHKKHVEDDSNLEIYSIIWLIPSCYTSEDVYRIQQRLRISINYLKIFEDNIQCEEYIRSVNSEDRLILILNDQFARQLVPRIEQLRQVHSIYIHYLDKNINQQWFEQFSKIKSLSDKLDILVTRIQSDHKIDDTFPLIIYNSNEFNSHFIFSQLLFDCLIHMNSNNKNEFISLCKNKYKDNENELNIINEFEQNYSVNQALLWYTRKSFIYRILNKALRIQNIDLLFMLRFFIQDICYQIEQYKCLHPIRVYRSHLMSYDELQLFRNSVGQFISINAFLSTRLDYGLELFYLYESDDFERVLFEIDADPRLNDIKFSRNIKFHSYFQENDEIIFLLGTIFQLENIYLNDDGIWIIRLKLCSQNNSQLKSIFHILTNEYDYHQKTNLFSFGQLLLKQVHLDDAEKYYLRLLNEFSDQSENIIQCYNTLGNLTKNKGDYELSIQWFKKAIQINTIENQNLIENYNIIGDLYIKIDDPKRAIEYYNKTLILLIKIFSEDHPELVVCLNNIAIAYKNEKKYHKALEYHEKALMILEKYPSIHQSDIAILHNYIGIIQRHLGYFNLALEHYQYALEICKYSFSSSYIDIAKTLKNMSIVYEDKNELEQSLVCLKKAATIYQDILSPIHPDMTEIEEKIQYILVHLK